MQLDPTRPFGHSNRKLHIARKRLDADFVVADDVAGYRMEPGVFVGAVGGGAGQSDKWEGLSLGP